MLSSMASFASRAVAEPNTTSEYERALVPLESEHGQALAASLPDFALPRLCAATEYFEAQIEASWCCIAAFRMALRALAALAPSVLSSEIVAAYTQETLFQIEQAARGQQGASRQLGGGVSLAEGELLLADLGLQGALRVQRHCADEESFGSSLEADLASRAQQLLCVNVLRQVQGRWTGHWQVVVASAQVGGDAWALVLDPAAHKLGPHWLPHSTLLNCMATRNVRGEARGYLALGVAGADLDVVVEARHALPDGEVGRPADDRDAYMV